MIIQTTKKTFIKHNKQSNKQSNKYRNKNLIKHFGQTLRQ